MNEKTELDYLMLKIDQKNYMLGEKINRKLFFGGIRGQDTQ